MDNSAYVPPAIANATRSGASNADEVGEFFILASSLLTLYFRCRRGLLWANYDDDARRRSTETSRRSADAAADHVQDRL